MYKKLKHIVSTNWKRQTVIVITFTCVLINIFAVTLYYKNQAINESNDWIIHSYEVLRQTRVVLIRVQDMEISQHSFLLTGHKEFLEPYEHSRKAAREELNTLKKLLDDNKAEIAEIDDIAAILTAHDNLLNNQIKRFQANKQALTVGDLNNSRKLLDDIRARIDNFTNKERELLSKREQKEKRTRANFVSTILFGSILSIIGLLLANGLTVYYAARGRKAEAELKKSEKLYTLVTQGINEGIYEYQITDNTVFYSTGFKRMLGYEENEFPSTLQTFNEHLHPDDFRSTWENLNKYIEGKTEEYRNYFRMRHKDGHYIWIMSRGIAVRDNNNKITKIIGTHTDITEQKEREEHLTQLNAELENFTYITSHDLRSPLVNLKGFAGELQFSIDALNSTIESSLTALPEEKKKATSKIIKEEMPEALNYIKTSVERLDQLTSAILDLSRIGKMEIRAENIDTTEMVQKLLDSMNYEIASKKVNVTINNLPMVKTDTTSLRQIFSNIIENAIKYLDESRPGSIIIEGSSQPGETIFSVSDNGRGIAENDIPKVFDMFKRARNVENVRGVGMGMAFVKATIQRLGGKIWVESELGKGTKFIFTIPNKSREKNL